MNALSLNNLLLPDWSIQAFAVKFSTRSSNTIGEPTVNPCWAVREKRSLRLS